MKYLVSFLFLTVSFIVWCSQSDTQPVDGINNFGNSINNIIENKKFLYYSKGHHGHIWSLVCSERDRYIIVTGNTRNNDCRVDTLSLNAPILDWGLDTLPLNCHRMEPVENTSYSPFSERLALISSKKEIIFNCMDTNSFSGKDSVTFNKKLNELKYLMYWLACPAEIKEKLPTPL